MKNFPPKANLAGGNDSGTATKFGAKEFNSLADENEGVVTSSGQTLTGGTGDDPKTNQLSQAASLYSMGAQSFQDSGVADAYVLSAVTGVSGLVFPESYSLLNQSRINFVPGNDNTGASTLNIGQTTGSLLGVKKILSPAGTLLAGGEIQTGVRIELFYDPAADSSAGAWLISSWSEAVQPVKLLIMEDQKTSGTDGGTSSSGVWQTRDLNTVVENTIPGASLNTGTGVTTLAAGDYRLKKVRSIAYRTLSHRLRIRDITANSTIKVGTTANTGASQGGSSNTVIDDYKFTLSVESDLELQHWTNGARATDGLGTNVGTGDVEIYSRVIIERL